MPAPTLAKTMTSPGAMDASASWPRVIRSSRVGRVATEELPSQEMVMGMTPAGAGVIAVERVEALKDGLVHLAVGLVNEQLAHVGNVEAGLVEAVFDGLGHGFERVLVELAPFHLQKQLVAGVGRVARGGHAQQVGCLHGVGAGAVAEDAGRLVVVVAISRASNRTAPAPSE